MQSAILTNKGYYFIEYIFVRWAIVILQIDDESPPNKFGVIYTSTRESRYLSMVCVGRRMSQELI